MLKLLLFVVIAVFVLACRSAEAIPTGSKLSDDVVDQKPKRNGKSRNRFNEKAAEDSNDERVRLPPDVDSSIASSSRNPMRVGEHLPAQLVVPNEPEMSRSRVTNNEKFKALVAELGIDMNGVREVASLLTFKSLYVIYDMYSLELMILGSYIFDHFEKNMKLNLRDIVQKTLHTAISSEDADRDAYNAWYGKRKKIRGVHFKTVYAKMFWLYQLVTREGVKMNIEELADMAFGSELFKIKGTDLSPSTVMSQLRVSTPPSMKVPEPGQHNHGIEYELDSDPRVVKRLKMLAKDPEVGGQDQEELRKKARHAVIGDLLTDESKNERN